MMSPFRRRTSSELEIGIQLGADEGRVAVGRREACSRSRLLMKCAFAVSWKFGKST